MTGVVDHGAVDPRFINLASAALGATVLSVSDEFFGPRDRLLKDSPPVFRPGEYDENGKWMDGWETRRRRGPGHDSCVIRLAAGGTIHAVDIDTTHFTGNYPYAASLEAAQCAADPDESTAWNELFSSRALQGNSHHVIPLDSPVAWTHLRLNIFPDGGIARLRVYGTPAHLPEPGQDGLINLASALSGTHIAAWNDAHFGKPQHLLLPGVGARMEDGWETRRRREPGNDWTILALGHAGMVERVEIDTTQFKGNYPDQASLQAAYLPGMDDAATIPLSLYWTHLLPLQKLGPHRLHRFKKEVADLGPITHVRFNIFPDGGVNRLRLFGLPVEERG
jgi:allantoicase